MAKRLAGAALCMLLALSLCACAAYCSSARQYRAR